MVNKTDTHYHSGRQPTMQTKTLIIKNLYFIKYNSLNIILENFPLILSTPKLLPLPSWQIYCLAMGVASLFLG